MGGCILILHEYSSLTHYSFEKLSSKMTKLLEETYYNKSMTPLQEDILG